MLQTALLGSILLLKMNSTATFYMLNSRCLQNTPKLKSAGNSSNQKWSNVKLDSDTSNGNRVHHARYRVNLGGDDELKGWESSGFITDHGRRANAVVFKCPTLRDVVLGKIEIEIKKMFKRRK